MNAGVPAVGERPQPSQERVQLARGGPEVAQHGLLRPGEVAEPAHVGLQLGQEARQPPERLGELDASRRSGLRRAPGLADEARHVVLAGLEVADDAVGVGDEALDRPGLATEDAQGLGGLAQARVGAPDHVVEVVGAPGEAGAELADDQAQPVAIGPAQDVVDQVEPDRRARLLDGHPAAVGQPLR